MRTESVASIHIPPFHTRGFITGTSILPLRKRQINKNRSSVTRCSSARRAALFINSISIPTFAHDNTPF